MDINDHVLKLTGKASLQEPLELGHEYTLEIQGEITTVTDSNNDNGTKDRIYKFVPILCDVIDKKGIQQKAKIPSKVSQRIRISIEDEWKTDTTTEIEKETIYQELGNWIAENKMAIYLKLVKRIKDRL